MRARISVGNKAQRSLSFWGSLTKVKKKGFGVALSMDGEQTRPLTARGVTGDKRCVGECDRAVNDLEPEAPAVFELVSDGLSCGNAKAVDISILMNGGGALASVGRDHEDLGLRIGLGFRMPLGVARGESTFARLNPNLEQVGCLCFAGVELAVSHPTASAHELNLVRVENPTISHAVFVFQGTFNKIAENLHVPVRVGAKTHAWGDTILIDDAKGAESHVLGVVVVCK